MLDPQAARPPEKEKRPKKRKTSLDSVELFKGLVLIIGEDEMERSSHQQLRKSRREYEKGESKRTEHETSIWRGSSHSVSRL